MKLISTAFALTRLVLLLLLLTGSLLYGELLPRGVNKVIR